MTAAEKVGMIFCGMIFGGLGILCFSLGHHVILEAFKGTPP